MLSVTAPTPELAERGEAADGREVVIVSDKLATEAAKARGADTKKNSKNTIRKQKAFFTL
jgi:hypothetical protein